VEEQDEQGGAGESASMLHHYKLRLKKIQRQEYPGARAQAQEE
jgi:hypothetical protein